MDRKEVTENSSATGNAEKLHIKNMVCNRCIIVVQQELEKLGIHPVSVVLGEVRLMDSPTPEQLQSIRTALSSVGFELIDDKKSQLIEQVKGLIIDVVHHQKKLKSNLSDYLAMQIGKDYSYISNLFSEVEGTTIEQYVIHQKIEKVKELLVYDELTLSEIAHQMYYSSVAHLSNQFKKITGLTPSHFKRIKDNKRTPIDQV
jgi:YesN/AraC family two-component response regulator